MVKNCRIALTGDSVASSRLTDCTDPSFCGLISLIKDSDFAFTNLEFVTPRPPIIPGAEPGGMYMGMPAGVLDNIRDVGFNLYNVANNHSHDFTHEGFVDTLEELKFRKMAFAGGGLDLAEARSAKTIIRGGVSIAILGAASTFTTGALAAEQRYDFSGRPGINPLRYETRFELNSKHWRRMRELDEALGTAGVTRDQLGFYSQQTPNKDSFSFLDHHFCKSERLGIKTEPSQSDIQAICLNIEKAKLNSDLVIMSLHAHEGPNLSNNGPIPAEFIMNASRKFIEAGADVVVGHGPHMLRALEFHLGKPIFYSLGNFMYMADDVSPLPSEIYGEFGLGPAASPSDVHFKRNFSESGTVHGFRADDRFWQTLVPVLNYSDHELKSIELHPAELSADIRGSGIPRLMPFESGRKLLDYFMNMSGTLGTGTHIAECVTGAVGILDLCR